MKQNNYFFCMDKQKHTFEITSAGLHILAMACMLLDHTWASFGMNWDWMTCIGRIAFPLFHAVAAACVAATATVVLCRLCACLFSQPCCWLCLVVLS